MVPPVLFDGGQKRHLLYCFGGASLVIIPSTDDYQHSSGRPNGFPIIDTNDIITHSYYLSNFSPPTHHYKHDKGILFSPVRNSGIFLSQSCNYAAAEILMIWSDELQVQLLSEICESVNHNSALLSPERSFSTLSLTKWLELCLS